MTAPIPDPDEPHLRAIDPSDGALMAGVFFAPAGTPPADRDAWTHIGYARPLTHRPAQPTAPQEDA